VKHEFRVLLYDNAEPVTVRAREMDIVDGALVFMSPNDGGYIAAFAPGHWVSVSPVEESRL
jgi:hypothetical protein